MAVETAKTADAGQSYTGATNGYTITLTNPNLVPVTLDTIYDELPAGFSYVSASTTGATVSDPSITGPRLTWSGSFVVPPTLSISLHFNVVVSLAVGTYVNTAGGAGESVPVDEVVGTAPIVVIRRPTQLAAEPAIARVDLVSASLYAFTLTARLTGEVQQPVPGKLIKFTVSGSFVCEALTDSGGQASCVGLARAVDIVLAFGYTASFAGDALYEPAVDDARLLRVAGNDLA